MNQQDIIEALSKVLDPQSGQSIILQSMVKDLSIEGNSVSFSLLTKGLDAQSKSSLNFACIEAVQKVYPQADVHVHLVTQAENIPNQQQRALPHVTNIIAVASGKGGVGKSTVSTNLALGLKKKGARVGMIDADLYGPSIPTMLGLQGSRPMIKDVHGKAKMIPIEAYGMPVMSIGFIIEPQQAVVLRGPRLGGIIKQFLEDVIWPPLDFLIIDLPPGTGDIQLTLVQTVPLTGAIIVTTPQEVAVADAIKAMNMFLLPSVNVPILGVVENMAWFTPKELPNNKYYIFGEGGGKKLAKLSQSVLLGQVPLVQGIREGGDKGEPIILDENSDSAKAFTTVAENTLRQVSIRNEMLAPTEIVNVK